MAGGFIGPARPPRQGERAGAQPIRGAGLRGWAWRNPAPMLAPFAGPLRWSPSLVPFAGPLRWAASVVRDDHRPRVVGVGPHAVPTGRDLRVRPEEQVLRVEGREVHAAMAHLHAVVLVPERRVERVGALVVHDVGHVLDAVGQVARGAAVAVHRGRDVLLADAPGPSRGAVILGLDAGLPPSRPEGR